jgi:hypothetical protein
MGFANFLKEEDVPHPLNDVKKKFIKHLFHKKNRTKKTSEKPNLGSVSLAGGDGAGEGRLETDRHTHTHTQRERERERERESYNQILPPVKNERVEREMRAGGEGRTASWRRERETR